MNSKKIKQKILPWIIPLLFLVLWQGVYSFGMIGGDVSKDISSPSQVLLAGWNITKSGELFYHLGKSARRAFGGLLIGGSLGFVLGCFSGLSKTYRLLFDNFIQMIRTIPHLALIPLVILWFGIDDAGKIFLVSLGTFFPVYQNTFLGIRNVDPALVEMGKNYGLKGFSLFKNIILPGAQPSILVGLRYALGVMWTTLIVAETISASSGIGYLAMNAREFLRVDMVIFTIILYALLGYLSDLVVRLIEKRILRWNTNYRNK